MVADIKLPRQLKVFIRFTEFLEFIVEFTMILFRFRYVFGEQHNQVGRDRNKIQL